jgi:hypothetical protein
VLVGAGAFLIGCAVVGSIDLGLIAMAFSSLPMLALLMVVWGSGGHVSEVFERQAQARDLERTRHYYREAAAGVDLVTDGLVTDSGLAELQAAEHRAHVGERAAA